MNVLSACDGISCGMVALQKAGHNVKKYWASEIDKPAIKASKANWNNIERIGDITKVRVPKNHHVDLIIGGTPCQGFSFAGKQLNFNDPRSRLVLEFIRLVKECKRYNPGLKFVLENVVMKKEYQEVISGLLECEPIFINSKLVSAQDRKRLYWTNIKVNELPKDKGVVLQDLIPGHYAGGMRGRRIDERGVRQDYHPNIPIVQQIESRRDGKTNCLTTVDKDNVLTKEIYDRQPIKDKWYRYLTAAEYEWLQTLPEGYTSSISSEAQRKKMIGNAWTVDVVTHIFKGL